MVLYNKSTKTKASGSGGKRRANRDKRLAHYGGFQTSPRVTKQDEKEQREVKKIKGGAIAVKQKVVQFANIPVNGKTKKVKIKNVLETPSNRHYARENVIVKGAIIETENGKARVTNRPGQEGVVNATLIIDKAKV